MAYQDFTTYTEVDASSTITVTSTKIDLAGTTNDETSYVVDDKGVGYFDRITIDFEMYFDSDSAGDYAMLACGLSNTVGIVNDWASTDVFVRLTRNSGNMNVSLQRGYFVAEDANTTDLSEDTLYYFSLRRNSGSDTIRLYIYSDAARTTLIDTLVVAGFGTTRYRYLYGFVGRDTNAGAVTCTGYVQNMEIIGDKRAIDIESGSSQYLNGSSTGFQTGAGARTIEAWVKLESLGVEKKIIAYGTRANYQNWEFGVNSSNKLQAGIYAESATESSTTLTSGVWYHVACTFDGTTVRYYINGVLDATTDTFSNTVNTALDTGAYVGGNNDGASQYWDGLLKDVRVFDDARTAAEIASDMFTTNVTNANLQAEWNFNEALTDTSGNGNTLTNNNAATFVTTVPWDTVNTSSIDLESGSSQYLSIADTASLSITGDMTIEGWFKWESLPANSAQVGLVNKWEDAKQAYLWRVYNRNGTLEFNFLPSPATEGIEEFDSAPQTATWYHYALAYDASAGSVDFYVDGSKIGVTQTGLATSMSDTASTFDIGRRSDNAHFFDGKIDNVRVWNVLLPADVIAEVMNVTTYQIYGQAGDWHLENNAIDATANANNLTAGNSPVYSDDVPFPAGGPANIKSVNGLATTSVKSVNGLEIASVKSINGLA